MAATLPAINLNGDHMTAARGPTIKQHHAPTPPTKGQPQNGGPRIQLVVARKKSQGKKEREIEMRQMELRAQQAELNKQQTSQYRNTYKHNLCLDMLRGGYHKSYAELFALIKQQNEERERAGPESVLWNQTLLENEPEKLNILNEYLTKSETCLRKDNHGEVYQCQITLARFFQETGDKWLADHFFNSCLATSASVGEEDGGKMLAEGHCNVGLAQEERGDHFDAAQNFELFHSLCQEKAEWTLGDGEPMHYKACTNLARIYTMIATGFEAEEDLQSYLEYLIKAYDMSQGGGDRTLEGEASYRLGVAYEKNGDPETALKYLNKYLDICRGMDDSCGIGKACQAIAKSYESEGKVEESIRYLEMFVQVAEKSKDEKAISRACSDLGAMFNSLGRYDQAVDYFNKSYNISRALNDTETISSSRVLFGVAAAHKMLESFATHVEIGHRPCMLRLIEWKDNRGDEFDKEIPEPTAEQAQEDQVENKEESQKEETIEEEAEETAEQGEEDKDSTETETKETENQ